MVLPTLLALGSAGFLFVVSFAVIALAQPAPPIGTLLICAGAGAAAALTSHFYHRHWLAAGILSGAVSAAYFLLVFVTLLRREQPDVWPLADAVLVLVVALVAAKLGGNTGRARPA